jgi:hypothetical protein
MQSILNNHSSSDNKTNNNNTTTTNNKQQSNHSVFHNSDTNFKTSSPSRYKLYLRTPKLGNLSSKLTATQNIASSSYANYDQNDEWHSVISEVSASEGGPPNNYNNNNNTFPQNDLPTRIKRLKSGIAVIKYGRSGQPKNRILRIDERGDRLYWLDAKNINKPNDLAKSINFSEVIFKFKI